MASLIYYNITVTCAHTFSDRVSTLHYGLVEDGECCQCEDVYQCKAEEVVHGTSADKAVDGKREPQGEESGQDKEKEEDQFEPLLESASNVQQMDTLTSHRAMYYA